jgi:hypothetical protein
MVCNGLFDELNEEPDELVSTENGMGLVAKAVLMFSTNSSHWPFSTHERSPNESSMNALTNKSGQLDSCSYMLNKQVHMVGCMLGEVVCGDARSKCKLFDLSMLLELESLSCGVVDLFV